MLAAHPTTPPLPTPLKGGVVVEVGEKGFGPLIFSTANHPPPPAISQVEKLSILAAEQPEGTTMTPPTLTNVTEMTGPRTRTIIKSFPDYASAVAFVRGKPLVLFEADATHPGCADAMTATGQVLAIEPANLWVKA